MERQSNSLPVVHYSHKVDEALEFMKGRMEGKHPSLRTSFNKLNDELFDGLEWNRIIALCGLSGSGKSTILSQWQRDFYDLNPEQDFDLLAFQMEMLGIDQAARDISSRVSMNAKRLYSTGGIRLSKKEYDQVYEEGQKLKHYPMYVIDEVGTVDQIINTILEFVREKGYDESRGIICTFDHSLLVKGARDESQEKEIVDGLFKGLVHLKKHLQSRKVKCLFIVVSQLNRAIELGERVTNPMLQYPNKTDLFASSNAYTCSDYVIITHKPALIDGIGTWYGPARPPKYDYGLPVYSKQDSTKPLIYWHIIKARFASSSILMLLDDFEHSRILEYEYPD